MPEPTPHNWSDYRYQQYLGGLGAELRELCLPWVQACRFAREQPNGFEFFENRSAMLGIDRLGLDLATTTMLLEAVADQGVGVPGTSLVLLVARPWWAVFAKATSTVPFLPTNWLAGLEVWDDEQRLWIGKRVIEWPLCPAPLRDAEVLQARARMEFENFDWSLYEETHFGWKLFGTPSLPTALFEGSEQA